jgi:hypothetical protein
MIPYHELKFRILLTFWLPSQILELLRTWQHFAVDLGSSVGFFQEMGLISAYVDLTTSSSDKMRILFP